MRRILSHPVIELNESQLRYMKTKRIFDIIIASLALLLLVIPMFVIMVLKLILDHGEPIFFTQIRIGQNGKSFRIFKFRTMRSSAPKNLPTGCVSAEYITPLGYWLRRLSLDELPQLYNVLRGEMSIIGPRPLLWNENEVRFLRKYYGVYAVKPGITGWAQINGRDLVDTLEKVRLDSEYVKNVSFLFDCKIFLESVQYVLRQKDVVDGNGER